MGKKQRVPSGTFVWHDLLTSDVRRAAAFYEQLLGWSTGDPEAGPLECRRIDLEGDKLGRIVALDPSLGMRSHWVPYLAVEDCDRMAEQASRAGASVQIGPTDVADVGRYALIGDPQGASLVLLAPVESLVAAPVGRGGTVVWNEMLAVDARAAGDFYTGIAGWRIRAEDMGEQGTYWLASLGDRDLAGIMQMPPDAGGPAVWLPYVHVVDVDAHHATALSLKAEERVSPRDIQGIGRFSVLTDPTDATFALFQPGAR